MASIRVRITLCLALAGLLAGCGGGSGHKAATTSAGAAATAKPAAKSAPQNAARQALWQAYGLAGDYIGEHGDFGNPKALAPEIGASAGNPAKREPAAIYVAAASGKSLQLVTLALDGTLVTLTVSANGDTTFNIGGACDQYGCHD